MGLLLGALLAPVVLHAQKSGPTIISQPQGGEGRLGEGFSFTVDADGTGPLIYQWRLNGVVVPGANNKQLFIPQVRPGDFGEYTVLIGDDQGVVRSDPAPLTSPYQPGVGVFDDSFSKRPNSESQTGLFRFSNADANKELGEPDHAGKPGGKSVWMNWNAPGKGIATFRTRGSSFDTLLAVYTGDALDKLVPHASDDDSDGNGTSLVRFNTA
ncbi:MAG: immunoglobulin domain-containing protein, partial [Opitutaceae bacterium]|nr:immunoglobulin domain-containing protein [Verrucomicrobiales bacterium]